MLSLNKPNIYNLLKMHAELRGELVDREQDADVVYSVANGTPFDVSKIGSEFL